MREKRYWVIFGSVLITLATVFYLGTNHYLNGAPFLALFISMIVLFVIMIPAARVVARKFERVPTEKVKKRYTSVAVGVAVIASALLVFSIYDEYRVKSLDSVFPFNPEETIHLELELGGDVYRFEDEKAMAEWKTFLGQYDVKKMNDREWDSNVSQETGFLMRIVLDDHWTGGSIYEHRILSFDKGPYYELVNDPIDMEWVQSFIKKHERVAQVNGE